MNSLDKINRYLYELNYKKLLNISDLSFEGLVEEILPLNKQQRKEIIKLLDSDTKNKIKIMIEGGIIV